MNSYAKSSISLRDYPEFLTAHHLVQLGIFKSLAGAYKSIERNTSPPVIWLSNRNLRFPKEDLILWLESRPSLSPENQ